MKGYFTGEDGTLGVPGRWEFRSGRWLANLLSAMGTTAAGLYADVAIAQELGGNNAILGGISTSDVTERIQEFFLERAEEILPVVWVESGTQVYVVMLEGLTIDGCRRKTTTRWRHRCGTEEGPGATSMDDDCGHGDAGGGLFAEALHGGGA